MRHPGGAAAAAAAVTARGETRAIAVPRRSSSGPHSSSGGGRGDVQPVEGEAAVSTTTGGDGEENDGFVGMTLADYMGGRLDENGDTINSGDGNVNHNRPGGPGGGRPGGGGGNRGGGRAGGAVDGHLGPLSVAESSTSGGRAELSSTATGRGGKVVRLAPAHIAPPSRPAPEWVVDMQVGCTISVGVLFSVFDCPCSSSLLAQYH